MEWRRPTTMTVSAAVVVVLLAVLLWQRVVAGADEPRASARTTPATPATGPAPPAAVWYDDAGLHHGDTVRPVAIDTPRGGVWLLQPGIYDIDAGTHDQPSRVTVFEGSAHFVGGPIDLAIQLLPPPFPMTQSHEVVGVVDDQVYAVSWGRQFPFDQTSERWQAVVADGHSASRYYTALHFTDGLAAAMKVTLGPATQSAFEASTEELSVRAAG